MADHLDAAADELIPVAAAETHLGLDRLTGELRRTTFQLRLFADLVDQGSYLQATIDRPDPTWGPGPRPDLRRVRVAVGPVVVFAASNFPFAFSVAGGDTASALAAGCPVVVKAHPGHPVLSARTAEVLDGALVAGGAPAGLLSVIYGEDAGRRAVSSPAIRAGAFTGSLAAGRALFDLASSRPDPIPFYAEMGSLNPVFVTRAAFAQRGSEIITGFAKSFTLSAGQFCTKPGLLFLPSDAVNDEELARALTVSGPAMPLLNGHVQQGYAERLESLRRHPALHTVVGAVGDDTGTPTPTVLATTVPALLAAGQELLVECFGPAALVVRYQDDRELVEAAEAFGGQLTATVHGEETDALAPTLLALLSDRAGRVLWNGWPTGVSVTAAMQHGGPYPATTSPLHTSVGTSAVDRFLRPVCYQSVPDALLPPALREANPLGIRRTVNGQVEEG
jgi:NADP-dependent aldehyde dehydrogenase